MGREPGEDPIAGKSDTEHGQGIGRIGQSGDHGDRVQRVAQVDGCPICCGAFAQHIGEGDAPEHKDRTLKHAAAPAWPAP